MALVCDEIKSEETVKVEEPEEDLEDGEIEDDDEVVEEQPAPVEAQTEQSSLPKQDIQEKNHGGATVKKKERDRSRSREKRERRHREKETTRHMTEAERSILHLRRKERMEREKWSKFRKEQVPETQDDFAINLEKTLASILKKDRTNTSDEEGAAVDERRKRKKRERESDQPHRSKRSKSSIESPSRQHNVDDHTEDSEISNNLNDERLRSPRSDDSEYSSDRSSGNNRQDSRNSSRSRRETRRKQGKNKNKNRDRNFKHERNREKKVAAEAATVNSKGICIFYLNGKCNKNDCIYSHEAVPPMKLELCKFYLMDCCAKGENCSYMHSDFPCKFYHMGIKCTDGDNCKFAHGEPLSDGLKQILFKHIETAPRDILGGFPRLSREETLNMMDTTQKNLANMFQERKPDSQKSDEKSGEGSDSPIPCLFDLEVPVPTELNDTKNTSANSNAKSSRSRKSRWQEADPSEKRLPMFPPFNFTQDQDMRITSNGDIDMRTLPPHPINSLPQPLMTENKTENAQTPQDTDIRTMGSNSMNFSNDIDIRFQPEVSTFPGNSDVDTRNNIELNPNPQFDESANIPSNLPKMQRELFLRIKAQQRENPAQDDDKGANDEIQETNWYSDDEDDDDDDENRLTIKVENEEIAKDDEEIENESTNAQSEEKETETQTQTQQVPSEVVDKLGDISKINITADITKLLSTLSASIVPTLEPSEVAKPVKKDPRLDPRRTATAITEQPQPSDEKSAISIYDQSGFDLGDLDALTEDGDAIKTGRSDVDLRTLGLPFKGMQNYTPATEIDASFSSHPPIVWKVAVVDVPRPDYSGLKLSVSDAEKTGDPRLRKIFRLSVEDKDTPASPKMESPRSTGTLRIDPRLRKSEEAKSLNAQQLFEPPPPMIMNYNQQLSMLQSSAFYQSLTSNQKLMLNQELASRADPTGSNDPMLNSILSNLNLIPNVQNQVGNVSGALNLLQNINKMNPGMMAAPTSMMNAGILQPGLLGAAPGIPNMPPDFPSGNVGNFTPNGLLGTVPPQFTNFEAGGPPPIVPSGGFQNYVQDDFYQQQIENNNQNNNFRGRDNRNNGNFNNRDRRRGGRSNFRNQGNNRNQFRRNHCGGNRNNNRAHTPP